MTDQQTDVITDVITDANGDELERGALDLPELIARLRTRYTAEPVPPCRVCGAELSIASMGGGNATRYACSSEDARVSVTATGETSHYVRSYWTQYQAGDDEVLAVLDALEAMTVPTVLPEDRLERARQLAGNPDIHGKLRRLDPAMSPFELMGAAYRDGRTDLRDRRPDQLWDAQADRRLLLLTLITALDGAER